MSKLFQNIDLSFSAPICLLHLRGGQTLCSKAEVRGIPSMDLLHSLTSESVMMELGWK